MLRMAEKISGKRERRLMIYEAQKVQGTGGIPTRGKSNPQASVTSRGHIRSVGRAASANPALGYRSVLAGCS
jgi:hypothetical protein